METAGDNLLICGGVHYGASISYDGTTITAPAGAYATCYVVMTDTNFNLVRIFNHISFFQAGGAFNDLRIWNMTIDKKLNVYFVGSYTDSLLVYGTDSVLSDKYQEAFIAKSDSLGNPLMLKSFGSRHFSQNYKYEDRAHCIAADDAGNIYVAASFYGDYLQVNNDTVHNGRSVGLNGYKQCAVFSLDTAGQTRWMKAFGVASQDDTPFGIAVDHNGKVTVCGSSEASNADFIFGSITYHYKSSPNGFTSFIGQFDSTGNSRWFYPIENYVGTGPDNSAYDVVFDAQGNSYITGFFDGYAVFNNDTIKTTAYTSNYLLKLDTAGKKVFVKLGDIDTFYPYPVALKLKDDKVFITGQSYTNRLIFPPYGLCCSMEVYFAMYDTSGNVIYLKGISSPGSSNVAGFDVAFTASGCGVACGIFSGGSIVIEPNTITTSGTDYYLVRFGDFPSNGLTMTLVNNGSDTVACGSSTQLQMNATPLTNIRYFWSADNDTIPGPFYGATQSASPKMNSTYYAVAYNSTCVVKDSIKVFVEPVFVDAGSDTVVCAGAQLQLNGNTLSNASYQWSPSAGLNFDTIPDPVLTVSNTVALSYEITNLQGCKNSDTLYVMAIQDPQAAFSSVVNNLKIDFTNLSLNGLDFHWDFGDGLTDTTFSPSHTYASPGTYDVCLIVTNDCDSDTLCQQFIMTGVGLETVNQNLSIYITQNDIRIVRTGGSVAEVLVMDLSGRKLLFYETEESNFVISKSLLPKGVYIINIRDESGQISRLTNF